MISLGLGQKHTWASLEESKEGVDFGEDVNYWKHFLKKRGELK